MKRFFRRFLRTPTAALSAFRLPRARNLGALPHPRLGVEGLETRLVPATPTVLTLVRLDPSPTNLGTVRFGVTFSEDVTGVDAADFSLVPADTISGAAIGTVSGSGASYTIDVSTGSGNGTLGLNLVDDDSIVSTADAQPLAGPGTGNGDTTGEVYTLDKTAPAVTSLVRQGNATTNAANVNFVLTLTKAVIEVDPTDFVLTTTGGITNASILEVTGTETTYTIRVATGTGNGTIRVDIPATATIRDAAGNALSGLPLSTGDVVTLDKVAPTVTVTQASTQVDPTRTSPIRFSVVFSKAVTGFGPSGVIIGGTSGGTRTAAVSGSGTTYTVEVSGMTDGTVTLSTTAGAGQDEAGNASVASGSNTDASVTFDATAPSAPPAPVLSAASDTEVVGDNITRVNTPTVTGTAEANSTVTLREGTTVLGTATTTATGTWSIVTNVLNDGVHSLTAIAVDAAGNTSDASGALMVTVRATQTANQRLVTRFYADLLGRAPDDGGLAFWSGHLEGGVSAERLIIEILSCPETRGRVANGLFQAYLERDADPTSLAAAVASLGVDSDSTPDRSTPKTNRGTLDQLRATILGSDEYFSLAGGTVTGFLNALYQDTLERPLDSSGQSTWSAALASGMTRKDVALRILQSEEADQHLVAQLFAQYLQRTGDNAGMTAGTALLQKGSGDERLIAIYLGSVEYASRA